MGCTAQLPLSCVLGEGREREEVRDEETVYVHGQSWEPRELGKNNSTKHNYLADPVPGVLSLFLPNTKLSMTLA